MKRYSQYFLVMLVGAMMLAVSCQKDEYDLGDLVTPTNLSLTYDIVGADEQNPNGDGSGLVNFSATADHAITFSFDFGDGKDSRISPDGKISHVFSTTGVNTYHVTVSAIGTGGIASTKSDKVEVLSSFADDEAAQFLTGGSTKSWYWAADQLGHLGLGPNDQVYENGAHTYAQWYQAALWEKSATSMY